MPCASRRVDGVRVSVLLAVHDGARSVAAAIESIRAQTFRDWEMIAVDDGSRDETAAVLASLDDDRIRVIRNPTNRGLAASLNIAFAASKGELIARMDADDVALPDRFARQVVFLDTHRDIDILGGWALLTGDDKVASRRETHDELAAHRFRENPLIHPTVMMRRRVLEELGGYDESLQRAQDFDLWLRAMPRFRFHNLQEPLIRYKPPHPTWKASRFAARVVAANGIRQRDMRGLWFAARHVISYFIWKLR